MRNDHLPDDFLSRVGQLGALQAADGSVADERRDEALLLAGQVSLMAADLASSFGQHAYAKALREDFSVWIETGLRHAPDFGRSRDALAPPEDGTPFFFAGPLRLANGGRSGWRMECFLALREEPDSPAYRDLYRLFPHPKNICQSSHLLDGSAGLVQGNNIVFFPENIQAATPVSRQAYALFFFNKFYDIYNRITLAKVDHATIGAVVTNPGTNNRRQTYLARCVWGYLHDYFHHQGGRPFDEHVSIKTRWYTGLLEETKVDLETWLACREGSFVDAVAVSEFILFDRAFRYPCEPDWNRNFDSGTGLLLLSLLEEGGGLRIAEDGRLLIDLQLLPDIARTFIADVQRIEQLPDDDYAAAARTMVRRYLPEGPGGSRIGLPPAFATSRLAEIVGSAATPITFNRDMLRQSTAAPQAAAV